MTGGIAPGELSAARVAALRAAYLLVGVGLAVVKWPLLPGAHELPLYEGVTLCLLVALSLLALLGVRFPERLLPVLVLETLWKVLWLSVIALPEALSGGLDADTRSAVVSCALVVPVALAVPWRHIALRWLRTEHGVVR